MKKQFLLMSVLLILIGVVSAQGIVVKSPKVNDLYFTDGKLKITWTNSGCTSPNVKINIFRDSIVQSNFVIQLTCQNSGSLEWMIPSNFAEGKYALRVKADPAQTGCIGDSGVFNIKKNPLSPTFKLPKLSKELIVDISKLKGEITITSPIENNSYEINKPMTISWNKNFGASKVNIYLCTETNNLGEKIFPEHDNNGSVQWTPPAGKVSWPGKMPYIRISTPDHFYSGVSGLFKIVPPAVAPPGQPQKKTIARTPEISNLKSENHTNSGQPECLSMGMSLPGRYAESKELKTGHWKIKSKGVKCDWAMHEYYFYSKLNFDLSPANSKEIIRAELMISLSGVEENFGNLENATNEYCNSQSRIFAGNTLLKTFSLFEEGVSTKIDLLQSVKSWAASNPSTPYSLIIKGMYDSVPSENTVCLKYYKGLILFVEYKE